MLARSFSTRVELLVLLERLLCDAILAQVVPNELIGIEIRGIAGQEVQLKAALERLHIGGNNLGAMGGMAVGTRNTGRRRWRMKALSFVMNSSTLNLPV
jgi:hypothetical protein